MQLLAIAFLMLVISYVIQSFLVKIPKRDPAALEDWQFTQADEGVPQTVFFGDCWTESGEIVWWGNYRTKKIKSGGKK